MQHNTPARPLVVPSAPTAAAVPAPASPTGDLQEALPIDADDTPIAIEHKKLPIVAGSELDDQNVGTSPTSNKTSAKAGNVSYLFRGRSV
jgi:hypothetical protein